MQAQLRLLFILLSVFVVITGCSTTAPNTTPQTNDPIDIKKRTTLLTELVDWKINGKIAFITPTERNSASLYWLKSKNNQQLNLTTYLGINVLQLNSINDDHTIELDGNEYTGTDLDYLIYSLTDLTLPTEALTFWIKALPYLPSDTLTLGANNLPNTLTSIYNNRTWTISYSAYNKIKTTNAYVNLPHKIKVKSNDLTINIAIKKWTI